MKINNKFNALDAVIIAVFLCLAAVLAVRSFSSAPGRTAEFGYSVTVAELDSGAIPELKSGDTVYSPDGTVLGTVSRTVVTDAVQTFTDTRVVAGADPLRTVTAYGKSRLIIYITASGTEKNTGYSVGDIPVKVGSEMTVCVGGFTSAGTVTSVNGGE